MAVMSVGKSVGLCVCPLVDGSAGLFVGKNQNSKFQLAVWGKCTGKQSKTSIYKFLGYLTCISSLESLEPHTLVI